MIAHGSGSFDSKFVLQGVDETYYPPSIISKQGENYMSIKISSKKEIDEDIGMSSKKIHARHRFS